MPAAGTGVNHEPPAAAATPGTASRFPTRAATTARSTIFRLRAARRFRIVALCHHEPRYRLRPTPDHPKNARTSPAGGAGTPGARRMPPGRFRPVSSTAASRSTRNTRIPTPAGDGAPTGPRNIRCRNHDVRATRFPIPGPSEQL
jgi:hypothetical protein